VLKIKSNNNESIKQNLNDNLPILLISKIAKSLGQVKNLGIRQKASPDLSAFWGSQIIIIYIQLVM